uniref:multifunctional acyl-CoA thioesterase I/protease I/lysophospholipase L1 n=1 Tax=Thaumasiovibrio occultus TaxID=1891184 RepID=UPI000B34FFA2|nr:multifunctional acyl-CoA thioesterase I/protease I/lysophospholipase L1 [Thaumasiovibrio occultus]
MKHILISIILTLTTWCSWAKSTLLIVGDSLSAGYQMAEEQSWPYLLNKSLAGDQITVINASISGDTAGNGAARLPALLAQHQPNYVLIALGANDGLRGFHPSKTEQDLTAMITASQAANAGPMLMQVRVPPNYGRRYSERFEALYPALSDEYDIPLLPFFLEAVITNDDWMMSDGLHPNASAQPFIRDYMQEALLPYLQ